MVLRSRRPIVAGNWKMNGCRASAAVLASIVDGAGELAPSVDLMVCPPATLIAQFAAYAQGSRVLIGAQDCHAEVSGPFTGDVSAEMLRDAGAHAVIVGHSERRIFHKESDADVRHKALAAHRAGLLAILCIGETRIDREAGNALAVVCRQLDASLPDAAAPDTLVVAYEPVWAIGTGLTPTPGDVAEMHGLIRARLCSRFNEAAREIRVLYGGSVNPSNAQKLMRVGDVDGSLVGGASLKADEFLAIAGACL